MALDPWPVGARDIVRAWNWGSFYCRLGYCQTGRICRSECWRGLFALGSEAPNRWPGDSEIWKLLTNLGALWSALNYCNCNCNFNVTRVVLAGECALHSLRSTCTTLADSRSMMLELSVICDVCEIETRSGRNVKCLERATQEDRIRETGILQILWLPIPIAPRLASPAPAA